MERFQPFWKFQVHNTTGIVDLDLPVNMMLERSLYLLSTILKVFSPFASRLWYSQQTQFIALPLHWPPWYIISERSLDGMVCILANWLHVDTEPWQSAMGHTTALQHVEALSKHLSEIWNNKNSPNKTVWPFSVKSNLWNLLHKMMQKYA